MIIGDLQLNNFMATEILSLDTATMTNRSRRIIPDKMCTNNWKITFTSPIVQIINSPCPIQKRKNMKERHVIPYDHTVE